MSFQSLFLVEVQAELRRWNMLKKNLNLPASLTANTKGNKRSRTRNDSYTAGQSVGECGAETVAARPLLLH